MPQGYKSSHADIIKFLLPLFASILSLGLLTGCPSSKTEATSTSSAAPSTRNNCYSLLHQLLDQQKDVSMLRFIKKEHADLKNLIKKIAESSGKAAKLLEKFAKEDTSIHLDDLGLPSGEVATRASIAATEKTTLLSQSGEEFELSLLLTQTEALSYAWHLAKVAGEKETQPNRVRALADLSEDMRNLHQEVFAMLLSKEK
jgi:hypothetical protein